MKLLSKLMLTTALAISAAFAGTPIEKIVPIDHVYVPNGFDANDSVEIIVTGFLPNLCHKAPSSKVEIKGNKVLVTMTSLYYEESNPFCPEMVVPFTHAVTLGVLDKGNYKVLVNQTSPWEKDEVLKIAESSSNAIDDYHYAYVTYVDKQFPSEGTVTLSGYNPSDCFELERIDYIHNGKDTYSVLPKMKQVSDFCPMKMIPFEYEWKVPTDLSNKKVLLHVRTMDGKSVNTVYVK